VDGKGGIRVKGLIGEYRYIWGTFVMLAALLFSVPRVCAQQNQNEVLLEAAQRGDLDAVTMSLSSGADVNCKDSYGATALIQATLFNYIDIARLLLSKGAQVDAEDNTGSTPWVLATELGYLELASVLKEAGATERFDSLEWSGSYSEEKKYTELVIDNSSRWKKTWHKLGFEIGPPEIDFNKYIIAGVFLGVRPTGGYGVKFGKPYQEEGKTVIPYEEIKPGPGEFVTQALTQTYAMKVFEKKTEAAVCREVKKKSDESK